MNALGAVYKGSHANSFITGNAGRTAVKFKGSGNAGARRIPNRAVPQFWLSEDQKRLMIERFDRVDGAVLGFEDMVSLQGKQNADKYDGSIESVAKAIRLTASPAHVQSSLAALFASVALTVLLRNGNAHLKNFGLLYTSPTSTDCRLSPVYDIVTTTLYLPRDRMALSLARDRGWPMDETLIKFAREVRAVRAPEDVLTRIAEAITDYAPTQAVTVWRRRKQVLAPQFRDGGAAQWGGLSIVFGLCRSP